MSIRIGVSTLAVSLLCSNLALAQNWSFDARAIALGGVGSSGNLATKMIDEQRDYTSIVLPFGLIQVLSNRNIFNPDSSEFDPIRSAEYAAAPIHYVIGRNSTSTTGEALFVNDIRNATLSRDLSRYRGFVPASSLLGEGLAAPNFGGTIKVKKSGSNFQGIYVGAGPYLSMHSDATISQGLINVLSTGINAPNAQFPMLNNDEFQLALAVTGGYRGRFAWATGVGSGSEREGLYVAANYNYLHGFQYQNIDMTIRLDTDNTGLITVRPATTPLVVSQNEASDGSGFAIDVGVGAVIDHWEVGFGANGLANRINWTGVQRTTYSLDSLLSGDSDFRTSATIPVGDARVELPVDYRGTVGYHTDNWTAAAEVGQGYGGRSLHAGYEQRLGRIEVRGGARYTTEKWNPTGGIGFDFSPKVSFDVAAYGTHANIERKRKTAIAFSIRFNHMN